MANATNTYHYYLSFVTVCIGALLLSYGLTQWVHNRYVSTGDFWIPTVCFAIITGVANRVLMNGDKHSKEFVFKALALTMARLLCCLIVIFIYSLVHKAQVLAFACHFMLQYVIFTIFELSFLIQYVKQTP